MKQIGDRKNQSIVLKYSVNKKQYTIDSRDFVEKSFSFYHNEKFYRYSSSVPEQAGLQMFPLPEETVRGTTIFNFGLFERDKKDEKIKGTICTQCDFKIAVPAFMLSTFLPDSAKEWYSGVTKFYIKNKNK